MVYNSGFRGQRPEINTIGQRIRYLRWKNDHCRRVLSTALKISDPLLSMYESGTRVVTLDVIRGVKCFYNVSYDWLMDGQVCTGFTSMTPISTHLLPLTATTDSIRSKQPV
jgi:hypothetical protein